MTTRPSAAMRRTDTERASDCCEYCLFHQSWVASSHQVDHVIAEKHGGTTSLDNLALSCTICNLRKASDIASLDPMTGELTALFNPRLQKWTEHFGLDVATIRGRTPEGRTTAEFLRLNVAERLVEREALILSSAYPPNRKSRRPK